MPTDVTKFGTMREGLYSARSQYRHSLGPEDLAIIINEGGPVPTVRGNPNNPIGDFLTGIFLHKGNTVRASLRTYSGNNVSEGCLTTYCGRSAEEKHDSFMNTVGKDFNGLLYLRAKP